MLAKGDKYFSPYLTVTLNQITLNSYQGKTDLFIQEPITGYDPSGRQLSDHKCPACPAGGRNFAAEGIQDHRPGDLKGHGADRMARKVRDIVQKAVFYRRWRT